MKISRNQKRRRDKNKHIAIDHRSGIKNPWPIFFAQKDIKNVPSKSLYVQGVKAELPWIPGICKVACIKEFWHARDILNVC